MKLNKLTMFGVVALSISALLSACGKPQEDTRVKDVVAQAQKMTREELFKKAAEELGTQTFHWYATSSRGGKKPVPANFVAALNKAAGTSITVEQIDYQTTVDGEIYTKLESDNNSANPTFSAALLQDGYQLQKKAIEKGFVNYIPKEWAEKRGVNVQRDANPFTLQFQYKTWMYHKEMTMDNVWDYAKPGLVIDTMNPQNENVNMDFLIQLTSDENAALLKAAFEDPTNSSGIQESELEQYAQYGNLRKYAFLFIEKFIANANFAEDDGAALNAFTAAPTHAAWIVYSKIHKVAETNQTSKKDIVIGALGKEHTDGKNPGESKMKGFGGFMYKHYLMLTPRSPLPWTACAFINFLSTTSEGYVNWAGDVGDYPSYGEEINKDRSKLGHGTLGTELVEGSYPFAQDDNADNVFSCLNDPSANWWIDTAKAPVETPSYIASVYSTVYSFIKQQIGKK